MTCTASSLEMCKIIYSVYLHFKHFRNPTFLIGLTAFSGVSMYCHADQFNFHLYFYLSKLAMPLNAIISAIFYNSP